ncbi:MAG: helix-turn-helix domain-containing protein [Methylohalobius sp.]
MSEYPKLLLEESEVARILGVSDKIVQMLRRSHGLPYIQIGTRVLYHYGTLRKWVDDYVSKHLVVNDPPEQTKATKKGKSQKQGAIKAPCLAGR